MRFVCSISCIEGDASNFIYVALESPLIGFYVFHVFADKVQFGDNSGDCVFVTSRLFALIEEVRAYTDNATDNTDYEHQFI
jgi:hypothetical protein